MYLLNYSALVNAILINTTVFFYHISDGLNVIKSRLNVYFFVPKVTVIGLVLLELFENIIGIQLFEVHCICRGFGQAGRQTISVF